MTGLIVPKGRDVDLARQVLDAGLRLVEHLRDANPQPGGPDPLAPMTVLLTYQPVKLRGTGVGAYEGDLDVVNFDAARMLRLDRTGRRVDVGGGV